MAFAKLAKSRYRQPNMATEVELKLYCSPDDIACIGTHPLVNAGAGSGNLSYLENTYFDTPDLALQQAGIALRIRRTASGQLQTVKCAASSNAGLSSRPEWETPFAGAFDFSVVDAAPVRDILTAHQAALVPLFTTAFERRTWHIDISKKIALQLMVDLGEISSGERTSPISEVELELVQGAPEDLLDFAAALATHLPLLPLDQSKAERGYRLFLAQPLRPRKADPSPLEAQQHAAAAFRRLATQGLQMWQTNQFGVLTSADDEFVHQFRVALRRLNSLLKVFRPVLPERYAARWTKRLKALAQITGQVRDLDVMQASILAPMLKSGEPTVAAQARAATACLDAARQAARSEFRQLRFGSPLLTFARDLQDLDTHEFPKNLPRFAERQLAGLHRTALKRLARTVAKPTPERAHRFRIALKHLRYACEFFAPLFDPDEMAGYAREIGGLQDAFGFLNDFHVALSCLQHWGNQQHLDPACRDAVIAWHKPQAQAVLNDALQLAEAVMQRCHPWCTECERRGLGAIRRRLRHDPELQVS